MAKVVMRVSLPAERAFADLLRHLFRCHQCTASMCLAMVWQASSRSFELALCRTGRRRFNAVVRSWNPSTPIAARPLQVVVGRGRSRQSIAYGVWQGEARLVKKP